MNTMQSVFKRWSPLAGLIVLLGVILFGITVFSSGGSPFKSVEIGIATLSPRGEEGGRAIPASGASCVTGDTLISTPNGEVSIKDLTVGDEIYSVYEQTGEIVVANVTRVFVHDGVTDPLQDYDTWPLMRLVFDDGSDLRITANHPMYSVSQEKWQQVQYFTVGERILSDGSNENTIISVEELTDRPVVYNLVTNHGTHNYFADGVLVHNGDESVLLAANDAGGQQGYYEGSYGGGYSEGSYKSYSEGSYGYSEGSYGYSEGSYGPGYSEGSYGPGYSEGSYYSEGNYYGEGSYYAEGSYSGGYAEGSYYSEGGYYAEGSYGGGNPPPDISADPGLIDSGSTTIIDWDLNGHVDCTLTSSNNDSHFGGSSGLATTTNGSLPTDSISGEVTYTVTCNDTGQSADAKVRVRPVIEDF